MTTKEKLDAIVAAADELKAENIEILDVREKTSVTNFLSFAQGQATATSDR